MKTPRTAFTLATLFAVAACGGSSKPAEDPSGTESSDSADGDKSGTTKAKKADDESSKTADAKPAAPADPCFALEFADLKAAAGQPECEESDVNPDQHPLNPAGVLDIKVSAIPNIVHPGEHSDVVVTITNKSKDVVPLYFALNPLPEFSFEVTTKAGKRVDIPSGHEPALPAEVANATAPDQKYARIKLAPAGTAKIPLGWDAIKYKWASAKEAKGAVPGHGYPKVPAGSLAKGKYYVRIVTPLQGVVEGVDKEVTAPRFQVEVK